MTATVEMMYQNMTNMHIAVSEPQMFDHQMFEQWYSLAKKL